MRTYEIGFGKGGNFTIIQVEGVSTVKLGC